MPCSQSIDITHQPSPFDSDCRIELMPPTPFPCKFDNLSFTGIPGQPSDQCNGRTSVYRYDSLIRSECMQKNKVIKRAVLSLYFSVAQGRQFDRTWTVMIDEALIALGTTTEPSKWEQGDKFWTVSRDLSHLSPLLLGDDRVFSFELGNFLSNAFNVPVWANASIDILYSSSDNESESILNKFPTQVLPLPLTSISGSGSSDWPRDIISIPRSSLLDHGNIIRAEVEVFAKASACEEFWALNPSGSKTNSTCNGLSTGEPHRELRIYIEGQLAGLSPIFNTIYTGGVAPMLWSAITSYSAHLLPSYSFVLDPWIGLINRQDESDLIIKLEIVGASNSAFDLGGSLSLWTREGVKLTSIASTGPSYVTGPDPNKPDDADRQFTPDAAFGSLSSSCQIEGTSASDYDRFRKGMLSTMDSRRRSRMRANNGGRCELRVPAHGFYAYSRMLVNIDGKDQEWFTAASSWVDDYVNRVSFSPTVDDPSLEDSGSYELSVNFDLNALTMTDTGDSILDQTRSFDWVTSGEIKSQGLWVNSFNTSTTTSNGTILFAQSHYQRLVMRDPTNSKCIVDGSVTHTVHLESSDSSSPVPHSLVKAATSWADIKWHFTTKPPHSHRMHINKTSSLDEN